MKKSAKIKLRIFFLEHQKIYIFLKGVVFLFISALILVLFENGYQNISKSFLTSYYNKLQFENIEALLDSSYQIEREYGIKLLQKLAKENFVNARIRLAQYLYKGDLVDKDLFQAKNLLLNIGDDNIANDLLKCINREMAAKDWSASEIIREIKKCDNSLAIRGVNTLTYPENLIRAMMQIECDKGIKNVEAGIKNLEKLASDKDAMANYFLGYLYAEGEEVPQDITLAHFYLDFACKKNIRESCNSLISLNKGKKSPNSRQVKRELKEIMDKLEILAQ